MERTLLLVDDDEDIGAALTRLLRQDGYTILRATSGQEGLELLARHEVSVIVSDQRMPGMTGVEFLSRAKELYPKTVRIILSGYADLNSVTDAINRGAIYKFLTKPWSNETLCANVLEAFQHYELLQKRSHLALEIQEANTTLASLSLDLSNLLADKDSRIEHISHYDQLTDLPNRAFFLDRLKLALAHAQQEKSQVAILLIDLIQFNTINDSFGLAAGDQLLKLVAAKLAGWAHKDHILARMNGNEFGLLLSGINSAPNAGEVAQKIQGSFARDPLSVVGHDITIGARIGIAAYPADGADADSLIKKASAALR